MTLVKRDNHDGRANRATAVSRRSIRRTQTILTAVLVGIVIVVHIITSESGANRPTAFEMEEEEQDQHEAVFACPSRIQAPLVKNNCPQTPPLPTFSTREEIGALLEREGFTRGAEVGVQNGLNARQLLETWKSMQYFALVDLWAHQENYEDLANVADEAHQAAMDKTKKNLRKWRKKLEFFRMRSTEAAAKMTDESLDYIYVDARHDYCGVMEDLEAYWPKVRPGGIMAGHDFKYAAEVAPQQDWSLCGDGVTVNVGAVRGAVEDFAKKYNLEIVVGCDEFWASWMVRKPVCT